MRNETLLRMGRYILENTGTRCTDWSGGKDKDGYPVFWFNGRSTHASRVLWEQLYGDIPSGYLVCYRCDNPCCLNPRHLFLGTARENTADALKKKRLTGPRRVTLEISDKINAMREDGFSIKQICIATNLSPSSLYNYLRGDNKRVGNYASGSDHYNYSGGVAKKTKQPKGDD